MIPNLTQPSEAATLNACAVHIAHDDRRLLEYTSLSAALQGRIGELPLGSHLVDAGGKLRAVLVGKFGRASWLMVAQ